ncbi:MAG: N-methyl-L-tryptophan oxidase [Bacteroidetes bacterium]|nr:N-methyl-L-tryptophan oxidase [Bacteroidota bacterium]
MAKSSAADTFPMKFLHSNTVFPTASHQALLCTDPGTLQARVSARLAAQPSPATTWDAIVLGVGSMGAATCLELARRGLRVLGLEQFDIPHVHGEHGGQSRIIRKAYYEHPDYVPLLETAYSNWQRLEQETGEQVYFPTGLLYFAASSHPLISGLRLSADAYGVPIGVLTSAEQKTRYPHFQLPDPFERLIEPAAGFLTPERCILLQAERAIDLGACIRSRECVRSWSPMREGVEVVTDKARYHAARLVITAGPWAGRQVPALSRRLRVTRQILAWVAPDRETGMGLSEFPCWTLGDAAWPGIFYGFPMLESQRFGGPRGLKLAHHAPATEVDPDHVQRQTDPADEAPIRYFLDQYMPGLRYQIEALHTCLYTNTPDEHFILDRLPGYEQQVCVAAGFSGHGFKFCSAVGEVMADFAEKGSTDHPVEFLRAGRFG